MTEVEIREMATFDPEAYGPVLGSLLTVDRCRPLDGGSPAEAVRAQLKLLQPETALAHTAVHDLDMARCCLSGIWLLHDFLDKSHTFSQSVATASGSFWHGIMHRREGDFSNAKYWFRKVGVHPVFGPLAERVMEHPTASDDLITDGSWDPLAMVDACQAGRGYCREVQQMEWELLFDHCYVAAIGG